MAHPIVGVPFKLGPLGAIEGCDPQPVGGQEVLGNKAVQDVLQTGRPGHGGVVDAEEPFGKITRT